MGYLGAFWLIVLGLAVSPNQVIARKPEWAAKLKRLTQFSVGMGTLSILWGAWGILISLGYLRWPFLALTSIAASALHFLLGIFLAFHVVRDWLPQPARVKLGQLRFKLAMYETYLGIAGIIAGSGLVVVRLFTPIR